MKIHRLSLNKLMRREMMVIENHDVSTVEWKISRISQRLAATPRGASLYSPVFTAAGRGAFLV